MKTVFWTISFLVVATQVQALELQCKFDAGDTELVRHYTLSDTKNLAGVTIDQAAYSAIQASDGFQSNIATAISIPSDQRVETMVFKNGTAFLMIATFAKQEDGSQMAQSVTYDGKCE